MKRFTIGVVTHNEGLNIEPMLDALASLPQDEFDIVIYDDKSTDNTCELVSGHPIAKQGNFHAHFSQENYGSPAAGRTYAGNLAKTEYVILFDGDDLLDVDAMRSFAVGAPSGQDMILSSYSIGERRISLKGDGGPVTIGSDTVSRILAGIGGKAYRSELLRQFGPDPIKGRSDDVRLNMRILASGAQNIYHVPHTCFYKITQSRKSTRATSINTYEVELRIHRYKFIQEIYSLDDRYLTSLRDQLRHIIKNDEKLDDLERFRLRRTVEYLFCHLNNGPKIRQARNYLRNIPGVKLANKMYKGLKWRVRRLLAY
jgi:glycosyltransferase involved in cell wall biosynthesis